MASQNSMWQRLRGLARRGKSERELDTELRFHIERRAEDGVRAGLSAEEARRAAMREFGALELVKEECRDERPAQFISQFWADARFGLRMLRKNPGFTAVAVLTLALGIGATTAIFSVVNAVLLRPLPYADPASLVLIQNSYLTTSVANFPKYGLSPGDFADWRSQARQFTDMAALSKVSQGFNLTGQGEPQRVRAAYASSNLSSVLGVRLAAGHIPGPDGDKLGGPRSIILGHKLWQSMFGADPAAVGRVVNLDGIGYTIAAVLPADFQMLRGADLWMGLGQFPDDLTSHVHHAFETVARLKPGVSLAQAQQEIESLNQQEMQSFPETHKHFGVEVIKMQDLSVEKMRAPLLVLMGVVSFVLLIACANIVNLLLARNVVRRRETALRAALGASRARLVGQQLTESVLLAFLGGILGLGIAWAGFQILERLAPPELASVRDAGLQGWIFVFAFGVCFLSGVLSGLVPALRAARIDVNSTLNEEAKSSASGSSQRLQSILVVSQIALALIPLISAGLLIRSFRRLLTVDPGFRADHTLTLSAPQPKTPIDVAGKMTPAQIAEISHRLALEFEQTAARIQSLPGVEQVGGIDFLPLGSGLQNASRFSIEGQPIPDAGVRPIGQMRTASLGYFSTMRIPLIAGRLFEQSDWTTKNVVINKTMAQRFWPDEGALGKRIDFCTLTPNPCWNSIVGVVGDVSQYSLDSAPTYDVYFPGGWPTHFIIRTTSDPAALAASAIGEIHKTESALPITEVQTLDDLLSVSVAPRHFSMLLLTIFSVMALLLATVGIYGVMSYAVSQRTREIGVRMALGAQQRDVLRMVIARGARLALAGIALGLAGSFAVTRWLVSLLYQVRPTDPATFLGVPVLFIIVALLACWIPARRAARVDPLAALRHD